VKLSPYCKSFPCPDRPHQRLLYSTRKASLLLLPAEAVSKLERGEPLPPEMIEPLRRTGMLVADIEIEKAIASGLPAEINRLSSGLAVAVILTMNCNFSCRYCYEGTLKSRQAMSEETGRQLVQYVKARFRPGHKKVILDFYGGEPLLAKERIRQIAAPLKEFTERQGADFYFTLVTNGSLLTRNVVENLKPFGLRTAKVTIDGPADLHNESRPFKSGEGSFEAILENLRECCRLLKIGIQGNYTRDNYRRFPQLLDILSTRGLPPDRLMQITFGPVMQTKDEFALADFNDGCCSMGEPWLAEAAVWLREEVLKRGYRAPKITPSPCMVEIADALTVHADGSLYKCMGFIGHQEYAVGDVWQGMTDYRDVYNLDHWRQKKKCRDCTYLPLCFGGCRFMEFQRHGTIKGVNCQKAFWEGALEKLIQQSVLYPQK
jgi:uncharacterized protein